jgi:hypothetical protein
MNRIRTIDRPVGLRQPQLHTVPSEHRQKLDELVTEERPLILTDHHRIKPTLRIRQRRQQHPSLRSIQPPHPSRTPTIEELDHNQTLTADQFVSCVTLPRPRRRIILMILGGHPTIEREPRAACDRGPSTPRPTPLLAVNPLHQSIDRPFCPHRHIPVAPVRVDVFQRGSTYGDRV